MRRHPPHHLSPAWAKPPAGADPEASPSRPKSPQQRSDQTRKPVNSEQLLLVFPLVTGATIGQVPFGASMIHVAGTPRNQQGANRAGIWRNAVKQLMSDGTLGVTGTHFARKRCIMLAS